MKREQTQNAFLLLVAVAIAAATGWWAVNYVWTDALISIARFQGLALTPAIAYIGTLIWKVHDTKKSEGLSNKQQRKLLRVAKLIVIRLTAITVVAMAAGVLGWASGAFQPHSAVWTTLVGLSIFAVVFVVLVGIPYAILLKLDLMRFEDKLRARHRELQQREAIRKRLGDSKEA